MLDDSSSINAMMHLRGHRSAIDAWEAAGAKGWGYDNLLPYYRRSEHTEGRDGHYRGTDGPMRLQPAARTLAVTRGAPQPANTPRSGSVPAT